MYLREKIEVKQNLKLTARERGKIVARREGHNIWLDVGREWIAKLIAYENFLPDTPEEDNRIKYMGLGIGGNRQVALTTVANVPPMSADYPGTNIQTDTLRTVTELERPVRVSGTTGAHDGSDEWVARVQAPAVHPTFSSTKFVRVFTELEVSYGTYLSVPLSEVGLFVADANVNYYLNNPVAYDTFDTLSKTSAIELEVEWTIEF